MNKYTEQLKQAREDARSLYWSTSYSAYWAAHCSAYWSAKSAYYAREVEFDSKQLDYQINKVLEIL